MNGNAVPGNPEFVHPHQPHRFLLATGDPRLLGWKITLTALNMPPYPPLPPDCPNLYLTGFMGTGKSVIGARVAAQLNLPFLDSDHVIESSEGLSIPRIFEVHGESYFRELEKQFVEHEQPSHGSVISCGGGLITNPALLERIQSMGVVFVLWASIDTIFRRIASDPNRPLLQAPNPRERIEALLAQRESIYMRAGIGIMTEGMCIQDAVDRVVRIYLEHQAKWNKSCHT
jgi:shikimate kinase